MAYRSWLYIRNFFRILPNQPPIRINRILCSVDRVGLIRSLPWAFYKSKDTRTLGPRAVSNHYQQSTYQIEIFKTHATVFLCRWYRAPECLLTVASSMVWMMIVLFWFVGIYFAWTMIDAMGCSDIVDEVCVFFVYLSILLGAYICWQEVLEVMRFPYGEWYVDCLLPKSPDSGFRRHVILWREPTFDLHYHTVCSVQVFRQGPMYIQIHNIYVYIYMCGQIIATTYIHTFNFLILMYDDILCICPVLGEPLVLNVINHGQIQIWWIHLVDPRMVTTTSRWTFLLLDACSPRYCLRTIKEKISQSPFKVSADGVVWEMCKHFSK